MKLSFYRVTSMFAWQLAPGCAKSKPAAKETATKKESNQMSQVDLSVNYLEFPLVDHDATKSFYESVFGWDFQDWGPDYICFTGAGINLGFNRGLKPSMPSEGVLVVIYANDLEKTETDIRQAGLTIITATYEFPGGRRFHFADPNGNEIAVWTEAVSN